jgi:hypothetical protein
MHGRPTDTVTVTSTMYPKENFQNLHYYKKFIPIAMIPNLNTTESKYYPSNQI